MTTITATQSVSPEVESSEQHSIGESFALHLLPGVFILVLFLASATMVMRAGFPALFAMVAFGAVVTTPRWARPACSRGFAAIRR